MTEVPPDIWDAARKATGGWMAAGEIESNDALIKSVARSLMAERERCAVVATRKSIAAAIRKGE